MTAIRDASRAGGLFSRAAAGVVSALRHWGIAALGAFVAAPFVVLCFFNHPAADDFDYARQTLLRGFWGAQAAWYRWWTGRFVNSAIMSMNPLVVRWTGGFKVLPLLLLMLLAGSMYFFVREVTRPNWTIRTRVAAAIVLLVLYLHGMPDVTEGLYWMSSATTYQVPNALCLVLAGAMVRRFRQGRDFPGWRLTAAAVISVVVVMGSNETSMVIVLFLLAAILGVRLYADRRVDRWTGLLLAVGIAAAAVALAAPGNVGRMTYESPFHGHAPAPAAIAHSVVDAARQLAAWMQSIPLLLFAVIFVPAAMPLARRDASEAGIFRVHPAVLFALLFAAMSLAYFPTYWSLGHGPLPRTLNVVYLLFLVGFFVTLVSAMRRVASAMEPRAAAPAGESSLPAYALVFLALAIAANFKASDGNVRRAYSDLLSGRALRFDREVRERDRKLAGCTSDLCEVDGIANRPATIFRSDIDPRANQNEAIAYYFGKKAVRLRTRP